MGWRFRRSVKILPGVRLNFGKKGFTSATIGGKYAKTNVSKRGTFNTYSLPGTGLSYRTQLNKHQSSNTTQQATLYRYCSQCHSANLPESNFCKTCGGGSCVPNYQKNQLGSQDKKHLLIILGSVFSFILLISIVSAIFTKPVERTSPVATNYSELAPASKPITSSETDSPQAVTNTTAKTVASLTEPISNTKTPSIKPQTAKGAVVIAENANLRKTPNQTGEVSQTLPENTTVEIIKQTGAWFYVRANGQTGWLHGNTIKLSDYVAAGNYTVSEDSTESYPPPSSDYSSSSESSGYSGYTGSSYSGSSGGLKTVHVNGYTRKDGTYVHSYMRSAPHSRH